MDNGHNKHQSNKFFEGFMWGLIIGGVLVFLMGTKKGKKLLKTISEEGVGNLSDLIEKNSNIDEEYDDEEAESDSDDGFSDDKEVKKSKPSIKKRFFRKRSN